jgi:hypothetical protein
MQDRRLGPLKKVSEKINFFPEFQVGPNFSLIYSESFFNFILHHFCPFDKSEKLEQNGFINYHKIK